MRWLNKRGGDLLSSGRASFTGKKCCNLSRWESSNAIRSEAIQFGSGQAHNLVRDTTTNCRRKSETMPGEAESKCQAIPSRHRSHKRDLVNTFSFQATPGPCSLLLRNGRKKLTGGRPVTIEASRKQSIRAAVSRDDAGPTTTEQKRAIRQLFERKIPAQSAQDGT